MNPQAASWILLILSFSCSALAEHTTPQQLKEAAEQPEIAGLCRMEGGFCGPTSWRMNFALQGLEVDASTLYNLGWNYGFEFDENPGGVNAWPTTYPLEQTEHAAKLMGFKVEKHSMEMDPRRNRFDRAAEEKLAAKCSQDATKGIIEALDQGKPVVVHWTPHLVLAYGHEGDKILFHDPLDTAASEGDHAGNVAVGIGKGPKQAEKADEWTKGVRSWQEMGCPYYVIEKDPKSKRGPDNIPWKEIYERNALRTLGVPGKGGNVPFGSPNQVFGLAAIKKFAERIEAIFPEQPGRYGEWGHLGYTSRLNAAKFLEQQAKRAEKSGDPSAPGLKSAAAAFSLSADQFQQARTLAESAMAPEADRKAIATRLREKLDAIEKAEREGGIALMAAAGKPLPDGFDKPTVQ